MWEGQIGTISALVLSKPPRAETSIHFASGITNESETPSFKEIAYRGKPLTEGNVSSRGTPYRWKSSVKETHYTGSP